MNLAKKLFLQISELASLWSFCIQTAEKGCEMVGADIPNLFQLIDAQSYVQY